MFLLFGKPYAKSDNHHREVMNHMKKVKRILALIGVILLLALYAGTLILACVGNKNTLNLLKLAIYATIVVPVLLWAYSFIYKLLKNHYSDHDYDKEDKSGSDRPQQ